jgi:hypothetical protein
MKMANGDVVHFLSSLWTKRQFWLLGFILCAALNLAAQEGISVRIYHVEGTDFALTLNKERTVFPAATVNGGGMTLERSGVIHTGAHTFLELQLIPSGTVVKLSDNTSLIYNGIDGNANFVDLGLLYGRIRVVAGNGFAGENYVVVSSGGVSARLEKGDLGVDYLLEPDNTTPRPLFRVYSFRGSAEVYPYGKEGTAAYFGGAKALTMEQGEILALDVSSPYTFAEKGSVSGEIADYWKFHNFTGFPPRPMPNTTIAALTPENNAFAESLTETSLTAVSKPMVEFFPPEPTRPYEPPVVPNNRLKNVTMGLGLVLTLSSLIAQGVFYFNFDVNKEDYRRLHLAMYIPLSLGLVTTLTGILMNPSSSGK